MRLPWATLQRKRRETLSIRIPTVPQNGLRSWKAIRHNNLCMSFFAISLRTMHIPSLAHVRLYTKKSREWKWGLRDSRNSDRRLQMPGFTKIGAFLHDQACVRLIDQGQGISTMPLGPWASSPPSQGVQESISRSHVQEEDPPLGLRYKVFQLINWDWRAIHPPSN